MGQTTERKRLVRERETQSESRLGSLVWFNMFPASDNNSAVVFLCQRSVGGGWVPMRHVGWPLVTVTTGETATSPFTQIHTNNTHTHTHTHTLVAHARKQTSLFLHSFFGILFVDINKNWCIRFSPFSVNWLGPSDWLKHSFESSNYLHSYNQHGFLFLRTATKSLILIQFIHRSDAHFWYRLEYMASGLA